MDAATAATALNIGKRAIDCFQFGFNGVYGAIVRRKIICIKYRPTCELSPLSKTCKRIGRVCAFCPRQRASRAKQHLQVVFKPHLKRR